MGIYLNPGKTAFWKAVNSEVFVDKTAMIQQLNAIVNTEQMYVCVSRPRRFGKSMAAKMLCAYYGRGEDSRALFENSELSRCTAVTVGRTRLEWDAYLGHFDVIRLVMTDFFNSERTVDEGLAVIKSRVIDELADMYPDVRYDENDATDLVIAYAITVHKSQGSEYPVVISAYGQGDYMMLQRNLLYTAITRCKNKFLLVCDKRAIYRAVNNIQPIIRNTSLIEKLT